MVISCHFHIKKSLFSAKINNFGILINAKQLSLVILNSYDSVYLSAFKCTVMCQGSLLGLPGLHIKLHVVK